MTAVATPLSLQSTPRTAWGTGSGAQGGINSMSADEVSRMFMPRKSAQRTNSSSSIISSSSSSSSTSTTTQHSVTSDGGTQADPRGPPGMVLRPKKPARGLWPASKVEPTSGISTGRPLPISASASGPPTTAAINAIHQPSPVLPSQQIVGSQPQQSGSRGGVSQNQGESQAILHLLPMNGTFERKTINVPLFPEVLRIGRQTNAKTVPTPVNGYFDSKVLSRQHAEIWSDRSGKIWIRDVKSSNGTFVNGHRLSAENRDSEPNELREQDILELGIDIVSEDQKTVVHHKVSARVEHAGIYGTGASVLDLSFGDIDPAAGAGLLPPPLTQSMAHMRGRNGSQGSVGGNGRTGSGPSSVAGSSMTGMGQQRHMGFWLTPITMEQVVKKLTAELKEAKQQSQDLQRTTDFFGNLLTDTPIKEENKSVQKESMRSHQVNGISAPLTVDPQTRYSEPPAPPPQQPLPEKPDSARSPLSYEPISQPFLKRVDTERPRSSMSANTSPIKAESANHISSLVEALASAKRELDSQSSRVKSLEEMLQQERLARESAEDRAQRLEAESRASGLSASDQNDVRPTSETSLEPPSEAPSLINGVGPEASQSDTIVPTQETQIKTQDSLQVVDGLQQRIKLMVMEMDEMKQHMECYKRRAEVAEDERASDRKSLAEMVEKIRRDDAEREGRRRSPRASSETRTRARTISNLSNGTKSTTETSDVLLQRPRQQNGHVVGPRELAELEKVVSSALADPNASHDRLPQSAPYVSMLGVVIFGVGLMAVLNGWQKVER
ncbi:MAG: hypothetical protein M1836_007782 [Candelina mexicana]|nr:MAG: hypothetical protein M1836_007782 [Candelina mexicana]